MISNRDESDIRHKGEPSNIGGAHPVVYVLAFIGWLLIVWIND